jgi:integrase
MKKKTKSKRKKKPLVSYGERHEYDGVSFWLYRRKINRPIGLYESKIWTCKYKIDGYDEIRTTTRQTNKCDALEEVKRLIVKANTKLETGYVIKSRKFSKVSADFLEELKSNPNTIPSKYKKHAQVIHNYFDQFFGNEPIDSINEKTINEYRKWRRSFWKNKKTEYTYERNGQKITSQRNYLKDKVVSDSTLHKEDVILRKIIEFGRITGDISSTKIIKVKSASYESIRKPSFTETEWKKVLDTSKHRCSPKRLWKNDTSTTNRKLYLRKKECVHQTTLNQRILLHDYINFMVGSGCRTTESMKIKWSDISPHKFYQDINGKVEQVESYKISVSGKSKQRTLDPQPYVKDILDRVKDRQKKFSKQNNFKFTGKDEYIWSDEDGNQIKSFAKSFNSLLESCGLLYDQFKNKRAIGSLRHTYGTRRKNLGEVDTHELAIQMGTSSKMVEKFYVHSDDYDRSASITRVKKSITKKKVKKRK